MEKNMKQWIKNHLSPSMLNSLGILRVKVKNIRKNEVGLAAFCPKSTERVLILGNGPSLKTSLSESLDKIMLFDQMCVNQFAESEYYEILKPKYYVISDPDYWNPQREYTEGQANRLFDAIEKKTTWEIVFFVSASAKGTDNLHRLAANKFVRIYYFSAVGINTDNLNKDTYFRFLKQDMVAPPSQTVLNTCLDLAIYYGFKEVYFLGADSSWHEQLEVDQNTNDLYSLDRHFYGAERILQERFSEHYSNMAEEYLSLATAFGFYQTLKEYGTENGVKIYNASAFSWIDVFERKHLRDL